jgi:UDPglucose--hexose-1-phosphate uridylyltransferase
LTSVPSASNEMRKDYLIDRWTIIAAARKKRPTDFKRTPQEGKQAGVCALEPGNEHMTPPAVLVYLPIDGGIRKDKDLDGERHKNWLIRCVSNLFPAFTPPQACYQAKPDEEVLARANANGHHEVLVESPKHDDHLGAASVPQVTHVVNAYIDRLRELSQKPYVKYVSIFRNHGLEAGASLSHAHSQIMAAPLVPKIVEEELKASREFFEKSQSCVFCEILTKEEQSPRLIWANQDFVVLAPWASINPFEFWIFPRKHQCCLLDLSRSEIVSLAKTMRMSLGGLRTLLDDPPYNFGFHQITDGACDCYHWHLEVYPRLSSWAGFEKSTGMYINVVSPEDAAQSLKEAFAAEEKKL